MARAALALLARLVDLGGRHRLGEGQLRVVDQDAAGDGHEHDPEHAARDQDDGRDEVVRRGEEGLPDAADEEGRQGEDGARGDVAADRADRAGAVLLEDRAARGS